MVACMKIVKSEAPGQFFVFTVNYKKRFKDRCYCDAIEQMFDNGIKIYSCNNKNKS